MVDTVRSYKTELTKYSTNCKCDKSIDWEAPFNIPLDELRSLVRKKFNWSLFPSRCPECKGQITTYED